MADVLVVEAAPLVRDMISEAMEEAGLGVTAVDSAEAALAATEMAPRPPDVLVTAILLGQGDMDGFGLSALLRHRWSDLGVIYLAEHPTLLPDNALDAHERCLPKPFEPARLVKLVCELVPPCPNPPRLIRGRVVIR
jgi:CheY-like chemotaxis protein